MAYALLQILLITGTVHEACIFLAATLYHRLNVRNDGTGQSYSLGTIPSIDDSKYEKRGNQMRVRTLSGCWRTRLFASEW